LDRQIILQVDEGLLFFLGGREKSREVSLKYHEGASVKHLVESLGIPHTEIGKITVRGMEVNFDYQPLPGDFVFVSGWSVSPSWMMPILRELSWIATSENLPITSVCWGLIRFIQFQSRMMRMPYFRHRKAGYLFRGIGGC
jgi:hypothetical protein